MGVVQLSLRFYLIVSMSLAVWLVSPLWPAKLFAQESVSATSTQRHRVGASAAVNLAKRAAPGRVLRVREIRQVHGKLYEIRLVASGRIRELLVDTASGTVRIL